MTCDPGVSESASVGRYAERLRLQREIDQAILRAQSVNQTADAVLAGLRRLVACLRASVLLFDHAADQIEVLATRSDSPLRLQAGMRAQLSRASLLGESRRGQTHICEDLCAAAAAHPWIAALCAEGVRCYTSIPLVTEGEVIGALTFGLQQPGPPPAETLEIALDSADHLALAIGNVRLREQVLRHAEELETRVAARTAARSRRTASQGAARRLRSGCPWRRPNGDDWADERKQGRQQQRGGDNPVVGGRRRGRYPLLPGGDAAPRRACGHHGGERRSGARGAAGQ